jgi:hypothetical protein
MIPAPLHVLRGAEHLVNGRAQAARTPHLHLAVDQLDLAAL